MTDVIRPDLQAAIEDHRKAMARPGTWWTARERTDLARLARAARLGLEEPVVALPAKAHEAARFLATTPAQTTEAWVTEVTDALTQEHYIELVEIVATTVAIDTFHRLIGIEPLPWLEPQPGDPSRQEASPRPKQTTAWLPVAPMVVPPYLLSLVPASQQIGNTVAEALYMTGEDMSDPDFRRVALRRSQIEIVATAVSWSNECFY